jgi:hypothetical protein
MQLSTQNQQLTKQYVEPIAEVIEWWAQLLADAGGNVPGVATSTQSLLAPWNMVAMTDPAFGEKILPCAIKCLASKNGAVRYTANQNPLLCCNALALGYPNSVRHL